MVDGSVMNLILAECSETKIASKYVAKHWVISPEVQIQDIRKWEEEAFL